MQSIMLLLVGVVVYLFTKGKKEDDSKAGGANPSSYFAGGTGSAGGGLSWDLPPAVSNGSVAVTPGGQSGGGMPGSSARVPQAGLVASGTGASKFKPVPFNPVRLGPKVPKTAPLGISERVGQQNAQSVRPTGASVIRSETQREEKKGYYRTRRRSFWSSGTVTMGSWSKWKKMASTGTQSTRPKGSSVVKVRYETQSRSDGSSRRRKVSTWTSGIETRGGWSEWSGGSTNSQPAAVVIREERDLQRRADGATRFRTVSYLSNGQAKYGSWTQWEAKKIVTSADMDRVIKRNLETQNRGRGSSRDYRTRTVSTWFSGKKTFSSWSS